MENKINILITTGIYPPDIGGPAKYAQMLVESGQSLGFNVDFLSFGKYLRYPTAVRHFLYFIALLPKVLKSDFIIALDTFSVCLPSYFVSVIFGKKIIIRTGGDFLWESYLDRTQENIRLSDFYKTKRSFNFKEIVIFKLTKYLLNSVDALVFSTKYQMDIFKNAYDLVDSKSFIIENYYGSFEKRNIIPKEKIIIAPFRNKFIKNKKKILEAFGIIKDRFKDVNIDFSTYTGLDFKKHLFNSYAVLLPSVTEISPNLAIEAVTYGIPIILTEECGIKDRLDGFVVWVNPDDHLSISSAIEKILDNKEYMDLISKLSRFNFVHTGEEIISEFVSIFKKIK